MMWIAALLLIAVLTFAVWLGLRMGKRWSGIAVRVCLVGFAVALVVARVDFAEHARLTYVLGLSSFAGGVFLRMALAFAGPAIFERWSFAAAFSTALNVALAFAPPWLVIFLFTGTAYPESGSGY
jgi:hypothetical protein